MKKENFEEGKGQVEKNGRKVDSIELYEYPFFVWRDSRERECSTNIPFGIPDIIVKRWY